MNRIVILIAAVLALVAAPLTAQTSGSFRAEYRPIMLRHLVSGEARIDPAKAYIFIRSPQGRAAGTFLKTPTPAEIADYEVADWPSKRWTSSDRWPIEFHMLVQFGPKSFFDRTDGPNRSFTYLIEVEPGEYTYLGPMQVDINAGTFGECYCMGSVKFEAKAGQITSLGDFLSLGWANRAALMQTTIDPASLPDRPAAPTDWSVPESLAQYPHAKAELRAAGRRDNFFNALVGRIPPVPGVLAYDRDKVIDLIGLAEAEARAKAALDSGSAPNDVPSAQP